MSIMHGAGLRALHMKMIQTQGSMRANKAQRSKESLFYQSTGKDEQPAGTIELLSLGSTPPRKPRTYKRALTNSVHKGICIKASYL